LSLKETAHAVSFSFVFRILAIYSVYMEPEVETVEKTKSSWGTVASILVMLVLFVFAALYVWGERVAEEGVDVTPKVEVQ